VADTSLLLGLVVSTVVISLLWATFRRESAHRLFLTVERGRTLIGGVIIIVGSWTALRSGIAWMMALALGAIAFMTLFVYFEQPHKEIR